ncbi:hypothetical protein JF770_15000 [Mycobacterium intracellulare]|uniref:hypothetical protein n=1 Tax=Mycobacterium intracellulare TaxID=1767 RepID=UPI001CD9FDA6|nr:hypothetical protein [Mycobacterium intracellulare]MCA2304873.1 hypothetical protein [Mycobacterium intracellulare]MCA2347096.1 hypothetical protein [Mycobacterium intracellulare]
MDQIAALAQAQQDIRAAQALPDHLARKEHANGAQKRAQTVLLDPNSTPEQKSAAQLCIKQARILNGVETPGHRQATDDVDRGVSII